jgi:integrase
LTKSDFILHPDHPTVRVREGKGSTDRLVPVHPELAKVVSTRWITASNGLMFPSRAKRAGAEATIGRQTGHRWLKDALRSAVGHNRIRSGRKIATHTLRHSAARHWLTSGVPINVVSKWLGHRSLQTTLIYLEILPDPLGDMARVP